MPLTTDTRQPRARASALPPSERRAAIVAATVPLLMAHGTAITTRQIAEAADVAEGTIFRVFPDKESLIAAAVAAATDPATTAEGVRKIDPALPLPARLEAAVVVLQERFRNTWRLMTALGMTKPPTRGPSPTTVEALAELFAPDADVLRSSPEHAAMLLRGLAFTGTHPAFIEGEPLSPAEIVSILLDGVRSKGGAE